MSIAKTVELSSSSPESFEDAVTRGIERASKTIHNIQGAWVNEMKVDVQDNKVVSFRVNMKVTFVLDDE
ncbi:MAG: dodecin family protein [Acidobacteriota bacterium]